MPGIGVVFNPRSGANRRDPLALDRSQRALGALGVVRAAATPEALHDIAREFRRLDLDVVAIHGGDGTNSVTLTALLEAYGDTRLPRVAFLRGGTMNTVAQAVGAPRGHPHVLLERLSRALRERGANALPHVEQAMLRVRELEPAAHPTDAAGAAGARVGFLFGAGLVRGFLAEYDASDPTRPLAAVTTLCRAAASAVVGGPRIRRMSEPFRGRVEIGTGDFWPHREYLTVVGGTIDQIGLGFRPFPRCHETPGAFHLLGIHASALRLLRELPRIRRGLPLRPACAEEAVAARAVLHPASGAVRYMIDGDLLTCRGPLEVTVGPNVRIVVA